MLILDRLEADWDWDWDWDGKGGGRFDGLVELMEGNALRGGRVPPDMLGYGEWGINPQSPHTSQTTWTSGDWRLERRKESPRDARLSNYAQPFSLSLRKKN